MTADQLVSGPDRGRGRSARRPALAVLVLLLLTGVAVERWERQRQLDALLTAAADAEQVVQDSRRSLGGLVTYSAGLLARPDLAPTQRAAVVDSLALDAQRFPPRVEQPRAALERVRPLPWDGELAAARQAYLARIDAWTDFVASTQERPDTLLLERRVTRPARERAAAALAAAADGRRQAQVEALGEVLLGR